MMLITNMQIGSKTEITTKEKASGGNLRRGVLLVILCERKYKLKNKLFCITLLLAITLLFCNSCSKNYTFSGGSGTKSDPYIISTASDILNLADALKVSDFNKQIANSYFIQSNDIDLNDKDISPIGEYSDEHDKYGFKGHYNGDNHKIENVNLLNADNKMNKNTIGFFALISEGINDDLGIENLNLKNVNIKFYDDDNGEITRVGGFVGLTESSKVRITNCSIDNLNIDTDYLYVGGFVGENYGKIEKCKTYNSINYQIKENLNDVNTLGGFVCLNNSIINDSSSKCSMTIVEDKEEIQCIIGGFVDVNLYSKDDDIISTEDFEESDENMNYYAEVIPTDDNEMPKMVTNSLADGEIKIIDTQFDIIAGVFLGDGNINSIDNCTSRVSSNKEKIFVKKFGGIK